MTNGTLIPRGGGESADVLGITVRFLVTKEMSGGAFSLFANVAPPGMAIPMHTHHHDHETMIVLRGRIVCRVGEDTLHAGPGDTIHMPAGVPHGWRTDGDDEVELLVIFALTPDSDYEGMFRGLSQVPFGDGTASQRALVANGMEQTTPPVFI
jgi:quercetin dioxygenase-like cupin family protein